MERWRLKAAWTLRRKSGWEEDDELEKRVESEMGSLGLASPSMEEVVVPLNWMHLGYYSNTTSTSSSSSLLVMVMASSSSS